MPAMQERHLADLCLQVSIGSREFNGCLWVADTSKQQCSAVWLIDDVVNVCVVDVGWTSNSRVWNFEQALKQGPKQL